MTFRWPQALAGETDDAALELLDRYYGRAVGTAGSYPGAAFDTWDSTGTRAEDGDRFTSDDLVAVTFLAVNVSAAAAYELLVERAHEFARLLVELGPDRDLVEEAQPLQEDWAGWRLHHDLCDLPGMGPTAASKLLARKRPRLRPMWDSVVAGVTGTRWAQWEPLRRALRADDQALHRRLVRLHAAAGLPAAVSAIRVLDVIAWLEGTHRTGNHVAWQTVTR